MAESMQGLHRTCRCAEVTKEMVGSKVTLMGWVQKARNKGGIVFVDLRDLHPSAIPQRRDCFTSASGREEHPI